MPRKHFGGRTLARSQALQLLFQAEATHQDVASVLAGDYLLLEGPLDPHAENLALGADGLRAQIDTLIEAASNNWSVGRMPSTDRCLLRLAVFEMLEVASVPVEVSIDEAVELAKAYGTDESSRFINGVLGNIAKRIVAGERVAASDNVASHTVGSHTIDAFENMSEIPNEQGSEDV